MPAPRLASIALVALLAAGAFAGCVTEIPDATNAAAIRPASLAGGVNATLPAGANATAPVDPAALAAPPRWNVGDWWRYEAVAGSTVVATFSYIVEDVSPGQYRLVTDNPEVAMWEEIWDISFLGVVSASDFSVRQRGSEVKFIQWPLANGTTWKTHLDDVDVDAVLSGPDAKGQWTTTFLSNNRTYATIVYDPAVRSFVDFDYTRDEFEMRLVTFGTDYAGPVGSVISRTHIREERGTYGAFNEIFEAGAASRLRVSISGASERFLSHHLYFVGPDNTQRQPIAARACTAKCDEFKEAWLDPLPGRWIVGGDFGAIGGRVTLDVTEFQFVERPFAAISPL